MLSAGELPANPPLALGVGEAGRGGGVLGLPSLESSWVVTLRAGTAGFVLSEAVVEGAMADFCRSGGGAGRCGTGLARGAASV